MQNRDRVLDLVQQLNTARSGLSAIADPATRAALQEAISVVVEIARDPSWAAEVRSRDKAVRALSRTMAMLQGVSDRNPQP
jgi:hypothetical protein